MKLRSGARDGALHGTCAFLLALGLLGCASVAPRPVEPEPTAADQEQPSRAEQVFVYQSRVANALLDRYPLLDVLAAADPQLVAAEARMTEVCGPLTEAVVSRLEGREPPLMLRLRVMYTTGDCERAAQHVEHLLRIPDSHGAAGGPSI